VRVGSSEAKTGVGKRAGVLADLCEAVIGAIHRDGGWEASRAVVERHWRPLLTLAQADRRDAKSLLQEWAQGRGLPTPTYSVVDRSGPDHQPLFTIAVLVPGLGEMSAQGRSKRDAEVAAATLMLRQQGVWSADPLDANGPSLFGQSNPLMPE
ncbi:MAG: putative dsRNA-binding protein, partial [Alphaproteobacteria bacterium]